MHVYFSCFTVYHLLITYILSITTYQNAIKHIIISDINNSMANLFESIKNSGVWDEVITIRERGKSFAEVKQQVDQLALDKMDVLHFYSFGITSSRIIFHRTPITAKIILTEEGTMTCKPLGEYNKWHRIVSENNGFNDVEEKYQFIDWNRIAEIWLLEPRLFDQSLDREVKKIELAEWIVLLRNNQHILQSFNRLFNYQYLHDENQVIYFDSYFSSIRILPLEYEKFLLNKLVRRIKPYGLCIKPHPGESKDSRNVRYKGLDVEVCTGMDVPWEVICLDRFLREGDQKIVAIALASSSAYNTLLLAEQFGFKNCYVVILHELIRKYLSIDLLEDHVAYTERAIGIYGPEKVFVPKTFAELDNVCDKLFLDSVKHGVQSEISYNKTDWFEEQYREKCNFLPMTYVQSGITIDAGHGWDWESSMYPVSDVGEKTFQIELTIDTVRFPVVDRIMWRPFLERKYGRIKVTKLKYISEKDQLIDILHDHVNYNGVLAMNGFIEFDCDEAFFEIEIHDVIKKLVICGEVFFQDYHNRLTNQIAQAARENNVIMQRYNILHEQHKAMGQEKSMLTQERDGLLQEKSMLTQERDSLLQEKSMLMRELENVYGSKSWKITKPLRKLGNLLRNISNKRKGSPEKLGETILFRHTQDAYSEIKKDHYELVCGKFFRYPVCDDVMRLAEGGRRLGHERRSTVTKPLVTVITVVYNRQSKLERAIKSVLQQTYDNIEYIIIDGASTDGTLDIIKAYQDHIDYYISEPDSGIYNAMNKGLELAAGKYIGILNSDDWFEKDAVEVSIDAILRTNSDYSGAISTYVDISGTPGFVFTPRYFDETALLSLQPCGHGTMFISADCFNRIGKYDENYRIVSDFKMQLLLIKHGFRHCVVDKPIHFFETDGLSTLHVNKTINELIVLLREFDAGLSNSDAEAIIYLAWGMPLLPHQLKSLELLTTRSSFNLAQKQYLSNALSKVVTSGHWTLVFRIKCFLKLFGDGQFYRLLKRCYGLIKSRGEATKL